MKAFFSLAVGCLISLSAWAQETVAVNTGDIVSPELKNQTVTFKLLAPNAKEVVVEADFLNELHTYCFTLTACVCSIPAMCI